MIFEGINNTMLFSIISFIYMLVFSIIFTLKNKIKSLELSVFKGLVITNILSLLIECSLVLLILKNISLIYFDLKIYNCCIFTYVILSNTICSSVVIIRYTPFLLFDYLLC